MNGNDFTSETLPRVGTKITVISYNGSIKPVTRYFSYTGTVQSRSPNNIQFRADLPFNYDIVTDHKEAQQEYSRNIIFNNFYTYKWIDLTGDAGGPLQGESPIKKAGRRRTRKRKAIRKRTSKN
jgi:hypothetical protein